MSHSLEPDTSAGAKFVALATKHAIDAADRAPAHDRTGTFPVDTFDEMKQSGFMAATVPEAQGGLGVASVVDLVAGLNRLGRGDGSTAIAATMHLTAVWNMARRLDGAKRAQQPALVETLDGLLRAVVDGAVIASLVTEPGTDPHHPMVTATPTEEGYVLNGRKTFATLSPIADIFLLTARSEEDGQAVAGHAAVIRGSEGAAIRETWDALGMRASGSHELVVEDCAIPRELFEADRAWGRHGDEWLVALTVSNLCLVAEFVGIAEAARDHVYELVKTSRRGPSGRQAAQRAGIQREAGEIEVALTSARSAIADFARRLDAYLRTHPEGETANDELQRLHADFQCVKLLANRQAIEVVDTALTMSGGVGYLTASPLSRLYRDVRAGPFMQPFSPTDAHFYIGRVALGLDAEGEL